MMTQTPLRNFLAPILLVVCLNGCSDKDGPENGRIIAQAYQKNLMESDLEGIVPEGITGADSALITNAYIQRWLKDALMMYEAEQNLPKNLDIDQLVRDYRASLIRHNYEESIVAAKLDSTVLESELRAYYEANRDQFQLDKTILRLQLLKVPANAPQAELNKLWYAKGKSPELKEFAAKWATVALLDDNQWHTLESVSSKLPEDALNIDNISNRKEGTLRDDNSFYYFRVLESLRGKQQAPYEYAREQARKVILHKRKQEIMEKWKEELYQTALKKKDAIIAE